jgi:PST family polysaccharide transporter
MAQSKKLLQNIFSLGIIQFVNYVFPLITVPYISRIIGPEGYGIINYASAFIGYFTILIAFGFDLTATRRISQNVDDKEYINKVVSQVLTSRILLFILSAAIFLLALKYFHPLQNDLRVATIIYVGTIAAAISPQFIFQGFQELVIFAKMNFVRGILNTILVFVLIKVPSDYLWLPVLTTFFMITINLSLFIYAIKKFEIKLKLISFFSALKFLRNEKMIFFSTVIISLYTSTNTVVLGFFAETREIGFYTTSQAFITIVSSIVTIPISMALYPFIGRAFSVSKENGINLVKKIFPIIFYITLIASLLVLVLAPFLIRLVYGHKFDASVPALQIISFLPLIIGVSNVFGVQLMLNLGLDKMFFKSTFIASIIGVLLNLFMSKYYGYIGTAWNCVIVESIVTMIMFIALKRANINIIELKNFSPIELLLTFKNLNKI